ncbi:MAG TPA: hypothetical protein VEO56_09750, partial [Bacteroidota bacterium]|nr:hypothetical protein [Bacteroidota bacterium]
LRHSHMALSRGDFMRVDASPDQDICSFFRAAGSDKVFVVLNFAAEARTAKITPPLERLFPGMASVKMKEIFSGKPLGLSPGATIEMPLEGRAYRVFVLDRTPSPK